MRRSRPDAGRSRPRLRTIRAKILLALLAMSAVIAALGGWAVVSVSRAGALVARTFDSSLMAIDYARAAGADWEAIEAAAARWQVAGEPGAQAALAARIAALGATLRDDLAIAAERAESPRATAAAAAVNKAMAGCAGIIKDLLAREARSDWAEFDHCGAKVGEQLDLLINFTAGDGFRYSERAARAIRTDELLNLAGTLGALLFSALIAGLLMRQIMHPVAAASAAAARIAAGELETVIPPGGSDELGALLAAMAVMRDNISAMMAREVAQRRSAQARLVDAMESSQEGVVLVDRDGAIALRNSRAQDFLPGMTQLSRAGMSYQALVAGALARGLFVSGQRAPGAAEPCAVLLDAALPSAGELALSDGRWLRVSRSATQEGGFVAICSEITALKCHEAELERTNVCFDAALENMVQGLCLFDAEERLRVANRRFAEIMRLDPAQLRAGMAFADIIAPSVADATRAEASVAKLHQAMRAALAADDGATLVEDVSDGRVIAIVRRPMADGGWVATFEDVTERHRAEERLVYLARHDALTGLPNRVLFQEHLEQAVAGLGRDSGFAVLCLDLDHFKAVNDTLGHPIGDRLLRQVAERLRACVRETDIVARLGGDEFAIIQTALERPEDAALLARRAVAVAGEPYEVDGHRLIVGASVGIAVAPGDGGTGEALLKNADMALYRAKAEGRSSYRFFEPEMDAWLRRRRAIELDLRMALAENQFEVFYQPLVDLRLDGICGFEALLRWRHPARGMVPPTEFIPVAEEIGLIGAIGEWVLRRATREAAAWSAGLKVAVNVSPMQFKGGRLVEVVAEALAASGLPAARLEIEITESVLLNDNAATLAALRALHDIGVRIAMDDFGTGYSSLSYLRSFPFDKIKIDQSFIRDLGGEEDARAIVRAIAGLAAGLNMRTTAEGVETRDQLELLRAQGCTEVQGYFYSKPRPAGDIPELLQRWGVAIEPAKSANLLAGPVSCV